MAKGLATIGKPQSRSATQSTPARTMPPAKSPTVAQQAETNARSILPPNPQAIPSEHQEDLGAAHEGTQRLSTSACVRKVLRQPGQPLDTTTRNFVEFRFGRSLGHVRVHTDATANASAHALDALAYTAGEHIVFGSGRYAPDTISGRRLLIHELAHVVQQRRRMTTPDQDWQLDNPASASEQAADATVAAMERFPFPHHTSLDTQLAAMDPSVPVLQRAVSTWGGIWDTAKYNTLAGNAGVDIELHFKPGPPVEATSIGIIQKVTSKDKGSVVAVNPTVGARSLPAKSAGAGAHIDQLAQFRNPLFATGAGKAADKLWDTPTGAQWGQHGYRHTDSKGVVHQRDAVLKDTPQLPTHGANASQIFEDTALAITGEQTGATYGSVQWGWKTDAAGKFTRLPLSKVSDDVPSGTFKQAEGLWNKSKDSSGNALIKFYTASREFVQADNTPLVTDPTNPVKTEIAKLPKNTRVEVINKGFWEKFNKSDPKVKWWKISVTDGTAIGKTGWVQSSMLGSSKVAGAKSGTP